MLKMDFNWGGFSSPPTLPLSADLVDWWGRRVDEDGSRIVRFQGKHWFVKCRFDQDQQRRDRLGYGLGRGWSNVAEVRPVNARQLRCIREICAHLPEWATMRNTYLVRLVADYSLDQLPHADIDAAVASELVFSLWIRRRDTHAANRAYIGAVPVFFDHGAAFLSEPDLYDADMFFHHGADAGFAGRWRVETAGPDAVISTAELRRVGREKDVALHLIRDFGRFDACVEQAVARLWTQSPRGWLRAAHAAGYGAAEAGAIAGFLERNRAALASEVEMMRAVIFQ